jgi:hypothetical protein
MATQQSMPTTPLGFVCAWVVLLNPPEDGKRISRLYSSGIRKGERKGSEPPAGPTAVMGVRQAGPDGRPHDA